MIGDPINRLNMPYWCASPPKTWLSIWIFDLGFVFIGLKWEAIAIFFNIFDHRCSSYLFKKYKSLRNITCYAVSISRSYLPDNYLLVWSA